MNALATLIGHTSMPGPLAESTSHYAAWVAIDLRLLLFAALLSLLTAVALSAAIVRSGRIRELLAVGFLAFLAVFAVTILVLNEVAQQPVFVVEAFFPFP